MANLHDEVATLTDAVGILPAGSRIVVAVSGGVDSMVLLHLLHELAPARKWKLVVAHMNHQLRGRSSDADVRFVKTRCVRLGVPCVTGCRDVNSLAKRRKVSVEMAARELRHRFLVQVARRRKCSVIAVAHHADDQAELVFLRLLRGSGSEGLGAMSLVGQSVADPTICLVRPLLEINRERIVAFASEAGIPFREDQSNMDRRFLRNRIRHELLPLLRDQYQPAIDQVLVRTASILSAEADCINALASRWLGGGAESFDPLPLAVKRRVIQLQSIGLGISLDFNACEELVLHAGRAVNAPGGEVLRRGSGGKLSRVLRRNLSHSEDASRVTLSGEGETWFAGRHFQWWVVSKGTASKPKPQPNREAFDAACVGGKIVLRHWRAGDRFQPIGMSIPVKLQDLFTDQKVPSAERRKRVVAESASGIIFWVEGLRIGDRFKLGVNTRKRLIWRWTC